MTATAAACVLVGALCVLRLRKLVKLIGWRGLARELRHPL